MATKNGKMYQPQTIYKDWARVRASFGLSDWTFHDLRHGAAGLLHVLGYDSFSIAKVLGHKKVDMTKIYTEVAPETQQRATGDLALALGGRPSTKGVKQGVNYE